MKSFRVEFKPGDLVTLKKPERKTSIDFTENSNPLEIWEVVVVRKNKHPKGWKKNLLLTDGHKLFEIFSGKVRKVSVTERKKNRLENLFVGEKKRTKT